MTSQKPSAHAETVLTREVKELTKEISRLKEMDFMQVFNHPVKFLWYSFLKGLMIGFGSVLGASVVVALFVYLLTQIRLVPVLGDFVQDVIDEIQIEQVQQNPQQILPETQPKIEPAQPTKT